MHIGKERMKTLKDPPNLHSYRFIWVGVGDISIHLYKPYPNPAGQINFSLNLT